VILVRDIFRPQLKSQHTVIAFMSVIPKSEQAKCEALDSYGGVNDRYTGARATALRL
jgi:hypothetical protein